MLHSRYSSSGRVQVAHFLEADMRPWALRLANCLFPGCVRRECFFDYFMLRLPWLKQTFNMIGVERRESESDDVDGAARQQEAWRCLDELASLGDTADAVLRAWRVPLHVQLPLTPAAWVPAVICSHVDATGALELHACEAAAHCDAMHAVRGVQSLTLQPWRSGQAARARMSEQEVARVCAALSALASVRTLHIHWSSDLEPLVAPALRLLSNRLTGLGTGSVRDADAGRFATSLALLTALTRLDLGRSLLAVDGAKALAPVLSALSPLADLCLSHNRLSHEGAAALAPSLALLTALTCLDLSANMIGADGAAALAPALSRLSALAALKLDTNTLHSAGMEALAPALGLLTTLTQLDLRLNGILGQGAAALAPALGRLVRLEKLDVHDNYLCDGVLHLVPALARLTALRELVIAYDNYSSGQAVVALRAGVPASVWEASDFEVWPGCVPSHR